MTQAKTKLHLRAISRRELAAEKKILHALDLVTAPSPRLEMVGLAVRSAAERVRASFSSPNVVGVGVAEKVTKGRPTGILALTFYVEKKVPLRKLSGLEALPPAFPLSQDVPDGVPVDVVELGRLRLEALPNKKRSPIEPGFSIGHVSVTAGTLGAIVTPGKAYRILSNSHVLANSGLGKIGDGILYPGAADGGGNPRDLVAKLSRFHSFIVGGEFVNTVDCALATPLSERPLDLRSRIPGVGLPKGVVEAKRGMKVVKVGRTTGKTVGEVRDIHFRFSLTYPGVGEVGFRDQILCSRYTDGGDSGSLVMERGTNLAVGLHFAGADGGSVFNPITEVLRKLRVKLVTADIARHR